MNTTNNAGKKHAFEIPEEAFDHVMATAYHLFQAGRYAHVEILCKGLIAADHRYGWTYSLYAATLVKLGRREEALAMVKRGLVFEPGQPKLLLLRGELLAALGRREAATASLLPVLVTGRATERTAAARALAQMGGK